MLEETVIGDGMPRHRYQEVIRFLKKIDRETRPDLDLPLSVDNDGTPQAPSGDILV